MIFDSVQRFFQNITDSVPNDYKILINLLIYTILIVLYAFFIWKFYKFLAKRDILQLNLRQYNSAEHPVMEKFLAIVLYTIEYIVILPFLVIFWFTVFSLFLLILSESKSSEQILLISTAVIASTRITAYISRSLSEEIAKLFPLTLLVLSLLVPNFFDLNNLIDKFSQIPFLFNNILIFMIFILGVELVLRGLYSIGELIRAGTEEIESEKTN